MKKPTLLTSLLIMLASIPAHSAQTVGTISYYYSTANGAVALKLKEGFSDEAKAECPTNNGYAGISSDDDPILKSTLLSAAIAEKEVRLNVEGCQSSWIKINAVYVNI
ncbi:hypothetical protein P3339_15620 [Microbulbifer sp. MLAF003]|uniref:hypothetical protein n=1 Tax=Microbulbifer sp. MLAF003 TaxID=3032582 RepID=UPI0024ADDB22|nr:hypothetical protein [Microbulbifer sp. MLAF003]WHI49882.1 hypothetical protein P3339_15620 [Microbulbifer sp. MLAF003]